MNVHIFTFPNFTERNFFRQDEEVVKPRQAKKRKKNLVNSDSDWEDFWWTPHPFPLRCTPMNCYRSCEQSIASHIGASAFELFLIKVVKMWIVRVILYSSHCKYAHPPHMYITNFYVNYIPSSVHSDSISNRLSFSQFSLDSIAPYEGRADESTPADIIGR